MFAFYSPASRTTGIDYCPNCRGIWLDQGELDKIIERFASEFIARRSPGPAVGTPPDPIYGSAGHRGKHGRHDDDHETWPRPSLVVSVQTKWIGGRNATGRLRSPILRAETSMSDGFNTVRNASDVIGSKCL